MPSTVRSGMADLIARVRQYIGDPAGANAFFTDATLQDQLDEYRRTVRYATLRPGPTLQPGSLYDYLDYFSSVGNWEADEVLTWADFSVLTPATADRLTGHWTFANPPGNAAGIYPPVRITGKFYDVWAASADLLEQWAAFLATTTYDFTADGQTFHRSQIVSAKSALAATYRRRARATSVTARRADMAGPRSSFALSLGGPGDVS